jgi:hypothetical protein
MGYAPARPPAMRATPIKRKSHILRTTLKYPNFQTHHLHELDLLMKEPKELRNLEESKLHGTWEY